MKTRGQVYRHRVTIYRNSPTRTTADDGQRPETAAEVCKRWAYVRPVQGRERMAADQQQADVTYLVRIRSDEVTRALTHKHWLTLATGERLNIKRIFDPTQMRREIELECTERA
jgi:SPP1 family predicted phage head-tail adaptor